MIAVIVTQPTMNSAKLYQHSNELQRNDARQILQQFSHLFDWKNNGTDTLLDIGCGSGNVTIDYILPLMPSNYEKLVGSDISDKMVEYAKSTYKAHHRNIDFQQMDIGQPVSFDQHNKFDHITSFYCLHWVRDQKMAVKNIYNLLRNDGECLLVFLASNPIFEVYYKLSRMFKWSQYMHDVVNYISPYHFCENPGNDFRQLIAEAGFSEYDVEVRERIYQYNELQSLKNSVKAVNPFLERIPESQHDEWLQEYLKIIEEMNLVLPRVHLSANSRQDDIDANTKIIVPYKLMICFAKK